MLCVCVCVCTHELGSMFSDYLSCLWSADWVFLFASGNVTEAIACSEWLTMVYDFALILLSLLLIYLKFESRFASHTFCTKMLQSNWRLKAIVPRVLFAAKRHGLLTFSCFIAESWILSFIGEICTHISTNPSYLISHCICLNTKTSLSMKARPADSGSFAWMPKLLMHKS
jgi:hypothetical protein